MENLAGRTPLVSKLIVLPGEKPLPPVPEAHLVMACPATYRLPILAASIQSSRRCVQRSSSMYDDGRVGNLSCATIARTESPVTLQ